MVKYVLIDPRGNHGPPTQVLMLEKRQNGLLNLVGGHVEEGETFRQAAARELEEESGYTPHDDILDLSGIMRGDDWEIAVFTGPIINYRNPFNRDKTEPVYWYDWDTIKVTDRIYANLRLVIPLIRECPPGWVVTEVEGVTRFDYDPGRTLSIE